MPGEPLREVGGVLTAPGDERGDLLQLLDAERARHLERTHVVAGKHEAEQVVPRVARLVVHVVLLQAARGSSRARAATPSPGSSCSSSVRIIPPSIVEMWCEKNELKVPAMPAVPALIRPERAPSDSQLSSSSTRPCRSAISRSRTKSLGLPSRLTVKIAFVRGVERPLEQIEVEVQGVEVDVDEERPQAVLAERIVRRRPRHGGHDDLVAAVADRCGGRARPRRSRSGWRCCPSSP